MANELPADRLREALLKGGLNKDRQARERDANRQRRIAEKERESEDDKKGSKPTFLRPSDIAGDYDFKRALQTTLNMPEGMTRPLTRADLQAFTANIEQMKKAYKGGISVAQVISLSRQEDIDRANKEIKYAVPVGRKNGVFRFTTNSGPKSDVPNHYVQVEFLAFNELVFHPDRVKTTTVRNRLANGRVKFECDCGRFNYWFRYLNTVAGTVLGRKEGGFPKIRNPNMTGIACKHILRTMHWIKSASGQQYISQALEKERTKQVGAKYKTGKNQMVQHLTQQVAKEHLKRSQIQGNLNREVAKLEARAKREAQALIRKQREQETRHQAAIKLKNLFEQGILSKDEYDLLTKRL